MLRFMQVATVILALLAGCGDGERNPADVPGDPAADVASPPHQWGDVVVSLQAAPPVLRFEDGEGGLIFETGEGILVLAGVETQTSWFQGFLGVTEQATVTGDFSGGSAQWNEEGDTVFLKDADGLEGARIRFAPSGPESGLMMAVVVEGNAAGPDQVRFRFACGPDDRFYGLGGQSHRAEHRGGTIPIRVTEQGLGKSEDVPESEASVLGHIWDCYFPLPYLLTARPGDQARAQGLILDTVERSRFRLCPADDEVLEIQAACQPAPADGPLVCGAVLHILPGPSPKDVVRQYTDLQGRPNPVPRWTFGPWVAFVGEPLDTAGKAQSLVDEDIAATTVWEQDWDDYDHPDLDEMAKAFHDLGLRVVTYFNSFLDVGTAHYEEAEEKGYLPTHADGTPYTFPRITATSSIVDLTNPEAWEWMAARLEHAWDRGVDGWMADYAEWVAPDMLFHDGRDGMQYGNLYTVDWARLNRQVMDVKRPIEGSALFFSRSGYLGSNPHLSVVWAGDQLTSFDIPDGLASVIPYGTSLGLSGVSAYGHDIAGYTGIVSPPSTKELYFRWTELGAFSPVMRTHRGLSFADNWNWNSDEDTIAHFRRYTLLHLRMMPYLEALHAEAMDTGTPAMRHVLLEFPSWAGAAAAHWDFLLGPSLFVAPVIEEGALTRPVDLPPGGWYQLFLGDSHTGPQSYVAEAPLSEIPVYIRHGGILPMLPDTVRTFDPAPKAAQRVAVTDVEDERLELWIGSGDEGSLTLADGTRVDLLQADGALSGAGVRLEAQGANLAECATGEDPAQDTCYGLALQGAAVVAGRTGPGSVFYGGAVSGGQPAEVRIAGGPTDRRYLVRLYRPRL